MIVLIPDSNGNVEFEFNGVESSNIIPLKRVGVTKVRSPDADNMFIETLADDQIITTKEDSLTIFSPKFQLNGEKLEIVKFSSDLLLNLDLTFKFDHLKVIPSIYIFDETLSYDNRIREKLKNIIIHKGGYLLEDSNFFSVEKYQLSDYTNLTTLRNSRVSLFWRGVELTEVNIKRILSMGLAFLLGVISQAELVFEIKQEIKNDNYSINIKFEKNRYIRIGIEAPVFSY